MGSFATRTVSFLVLFAFGAARIGEAGGRIYIEPLASAIM